MKKTLFSCVITFSFFATLISGALLPSDTQAQFKKLTDAQRADTANGTFEGAITSIVGFIASLLAIIAMLMIMTAGVMYMTSAGDSGRVDTAKAWLTWGIIGLVIALLAYVIVNAIAAALGAGN